MTTEDIKQRAKINPDTGCWEWLGFTLIFEGVAEAWKEKRLFNVNSLAGLVIVVLATWLLR